MKRIILQIDGGDIKGIIPAYLLREIENKLGHSINKHLSLISGTSTGSVIGGVKAAGVPASTIYDFYVNEVIEAFKQKQKFWYEPWTWLNPVYKRQLFIDLLLKVVGGKQLMDLEVPYTAVAYGLCKKASHFIKSWDNEEEHFPLAQVIGWSALSAAWFFGSIKVPYFQWDYDNHRYHPKFGEVFNDGGQGINNCTILYDLIEIMAMNWNYNDEVVLLSLGCGHESEDKSIRTYNQAKRVSYLKQILLYLNEARDESVSLQVGSAQYVAANRPNFKFYRLDCELPEKALKFGAFQYKNLYIEKAKELVEEIPWKIFE